MFIEILIMMVKKLETTKTTILHVKSCKDMDEFYKQNTEWNNQPQENIYYMIPFIWVKK